jgi:hypothetical protein
VSLNDTLDGSESDPDAGEFILSVESLKGKKEFSGVAHREAGAVVGDTKSLLPVL